MLAAMAAGAVLAPGWFFFLLGAGLPGGRRHFATRLTRARAGFAGILLGMVFFNAPDGTVALDPVTTGWRVVRADARLR